MTHVITRTSDDYLETVCQIDKECRLSVGLRFQRTEIALDISAAEKLLSDLANAVERIRVSVQEIEENEYYARSSWWG